MARRNTILVSKTLYHIGVVTLITAIMWTLISVMQAINKNPTKIQVDKDILEPITIGIDKDTLEKISNRKKIDLNFEPQSSAPIVASNSATTSSSATINEGGQ